MRYLVDTQVFIWWLENLGKLKGSTRSILENKQNQILVSTITGVEISIKQKLGKIKLKTTLRTMFKISDFEVLNLNLEHALKLGQLPIYHKDPFDRILIAQAKAEKLTFITSDPKIWKYKLSLIKA